MSEKQKRLQEYKNALFFLSQMRADDLIMHGEVEEDLFYNGFGKVISSLRHVFLKFHIGTKRDKRKLLQLITRVDRYIDTEIKGGGNHGRAHERKNRKNEKGG